MAENLEADKATLYFDGVCNLCNRTVDFLIRHDRNGELRYASLQGETARTAVPEFVQEQGLGTVVLVDRDGKHVRSTAIGRSLRIVGGFWGMLGSLLLLIPRPIRDAAYRWVARNRFRWFGRRDSCRLPTPEERLLFLP